MGASYTLFFRIRAHDDRLHTCIVYSPCRNVAGQCIPKCSLCLRPPGFLPANRRPHRSQRLVLPRSPPPRRRQVRFLQQRLPHRWLPKPDSASRRQPVEWRIVCTDNHQYEIARSFCRSRAEPLRSALKGYLRTKRAVIQQVTQVKSVFLTWQTPRSIIVLAAERRMAERQHPVIGAGSHVRIITLCVLTIVPIIGIAPTKNEEASLTRAVDQYECEHLTIRYLDFIEVFRVPGAAQL